MAANHTKKGELKQVKEWMAELTEAVGDIQESQIPTLFDAIDDIKDNHIKHLNWKLNGTLFFMSILTGCLVALTVCLITVVH